jgi:hypothetical protein
MIREIGISVFLQRVRAYVKPEEHAEKQRRRLQFKAYVVK